VRAGEPCGLLVPAIAECLAPKCHKKRAVQPQWRHRDKAMVNAWLRRR
jgi:hypothetical protein